MKRFIQWESSIDGHDRNAVFNYVSRFLVKHGIADDVDNLRQHFLTRERQGNTVIADNLAIPHTQSSDIKQAAMLYLRAPQPVAWNDGQEIGRFIFILLPEQAAKSDLLEMKNFFIQMANAQTMEWLADGTYHEVSKIINGETD